MSVTAVSLALLLQGGAPVQVDSARAALPNDNRTAAGVRVGDTVSVRLIAARVRWYIHAEPGPAFDVLAFAEEGRAPTVPGPLLRVRAGTPVSVSVRNPLADTLIVHGLGVRGDGKPDSLVVPPSATTEARFAAGRPGTYIYWGVTTATGRRTLLSRPGRETQLSGAFVIDPPVGPVPPDRVLLITTLTDTVNADGRSFRDRHGVPAREFVSINGKSWPDTERLTHAVGDSIWWRVLNVSLSPHPMHLHGFYFRVDGRGDDGTDADSTYAPDMRRMAVTELLMQGQTMSIVWSPDRPGGWIFHCHLNIHAVREAPADRRDVMSQPEGHPSVGSGQVHYDPDRHALTGMNGLVLGITVTGRPALSEANVTATPNARRHARRLRLYVQSDSQPGDTTRRFAYVLRRGAEPRPDSLEYPGPVLVLTRGEPTAIEVVNRTSEPTAVHWHGIELESYYDGVVGFGGTPGVRTTPAIRPGQTFEVRITPKRAGTFMYHTHFDELRQTYGGLVGVIVVLEPGERWDPERDRVFVITDPSSLPPRRYYINGSLVPPPQDLRVGTTYRFRIANPSADAPTVRFRITPDSGAFGVAVPIGGEALPWRPVAKDGWPLSGPLASVRRSGQRVVSGETADFEFTPDRPGEFRLEAFQVDPVRGVVIPAAAVRLRVSPASR